MKKNHKILFIILLTVAGLFLLSDFLMFVIPYPELKEFRNKEYSTRFYDRNNQLIYVNSVDDGIRREFTPLKEIPKDVRKIFLKAEDKRFYFHNGVDFVAVLNAFFQNKSSGRTVRGASTLTMQIVKMMSPEKPRTVKQKIQDAIDARRIEVKLSKKKILELYLNSVPFGKSCEGITSAARTFYGSELRDLNPYEIACLSVIPRRPVAYDPVKFPDENSERAFLIYKSAFSVPKKKISSVKEKIKNSAHNSYEYEYPFFMPHYMNYLQAEYKKNGSLPYEIKTTTDLEVYFQAESYIYDALRNADGSRITNASLLLIDNKDNSVITWIGNHNWYDSANGGQIDGVLVKNQPGSSMKPFLYALALDLSQDEEKENGDRPLNYSPSSVLADVQKEYGGDEIYIPSNFNNRYNGPVRFRIALASSLNVPAVDILSEVGVETYLDKLYELGFDSLRNTGIDAYLGLALGAGEVSLYELVNAFSVFARGGLSPANLYKDPYQIYSKDTASLICSILSDKGARALGFGYTQTFQTDYPSIFKTGTSNQYQNIVAVGSTPEYTIGVWMGNFVGQTVRGKTGSSLPAWVAKKLLDDLVKKEKDKMGTDPEYSSFPEPENWSKKKICSVSGMKPGRFCNSTVYEYVKNGTDLPECNWHRYENGEIQIYYPSIYQNWARNTLNNGNVDYSSSELQIISPQNNSLYYYSEMNSELQAIPVEVIGGSDETLIVRYDERIIDEIQRPFVFKLPVEKGNHICSVSCGQENIEINFQVK